MDDRGGGESLREARAPAWPSLDGLRACAVLAVVGYHAANPVMPGGAVGVDVFFVLSGFLITTLLVREWQSTRAIDLARFYARRALRLLPVLIAVLVLVVVVGTLTVKHHHRLVPTAFSALFYFANFKAADGAADPLLVHTWSLSLEEQFYLTWPLVLVLALGAKSVRRRPRLLATALALLFAAMVGWHLYLAQSGVSSLSLIYRPDTRGMGLVLGCALGVLVGFGLVPDHSRAHRRLRAAGLAAAASLIAVAFLFPSQAWPDRSGLGLAAACLASVVLIAERVVCPGRLLSSVLELPAMRFVGRLSYAIYLVHVPVYDEIITLHPSTPKVARLFLCLAISLTLAWVLHLAVEQPFLRLKRRFERLRPPPEPVAGIALPRHPAADS